MKHSTDKILTTHVGSLPRPHDLLDVLKSKLEGESVDDKTYGDMLAKSVNEVISWQSEVGVDVVCDGEMSKPGHAIYINQRLDGFEPRPDYVSSNFKKEKEVFNEYYDDYFKRAMHGGCIAPSPDIFCTGPIKYVGHDDLQTDIDNLKASAKATGATEAFMPCAAITGVGHNDYYKTEEEYFFAVAEALSIEYRAIVDAGLLLQVDDPFLPLVFVNEAYTKEEQHKRAAMLVEAVNHSIKGIPEDKIRYHSCYGINCGPRVYEPDLPEFIEYVLGVNAGCYSFEAANVRHEHEYRIWDDQKLPDGKMLMPGVVTHSSPIIEHPEYVAERIIRFADRVGKENVIASTDCGFSSQAMYKTEIHPKIIRRKFEALRKGADLATDALWK